MLGRLTVSAVVVIGLFTATVRLPASPCIITNTADSKPCAPGSCANKQCCATSHERTGPLAQTLAKSSIADETLAATPPIVSIPRPIQALAAGQYCPRVAFGLASQDRSALLCTFLI
jgi:hypothetical protein